MAAVGNTGLRHYTFTHGCTSCSAQDEEFASSAPETDYGQFVPPEARYTP